jgi:hypothetical protein
LEKVQCVLKDAYAACVTVPLSFAAEWFILSKVFKILELFLGNAVSTVAVFEMVANPTQARWVFL